MSPIRMEKIEAGIRTVMAFKEAFNRHDAAAIMQLMTDDCALETSEPPPDGTAYSGKEAVTAYWKNFFKKSPNAHLEIEELAGIGLRCILRWKLTCGDGPEKKEHLRGVDIFQLKSGSICKQYSYVKGQVN